MEKQQTILKSSLILTFFIIVSFASVLAAQTIFVRYIPTEEYGNYRQLILILLTSVGVFALGLHNSLLFFYQREKKNDYLSLIVFSYFVSKIIVRPAHLNEISVSIPGK